VRRQGGRGFAPPHQMSANPQQLTHADRQVSAH
jgi:hypothetical protein